MPTSESFSWNSSASGALLLGAGFLPFRGDGEGEALGVAVAFCLAGLGLLGFLTRLESPRMDRKLFGIFFILPTSQGK